MKAAPKLLTYPAFVLLAKTFNELDRLTEVVKVLKERNA